MSFGSSYDNHPTALIINGLMLAKTGQAKEGEKSCVKPAKSSAPSQQSGQK